jgi:hypothetical protein
MQAMIGQFIFFYRNNCRGAASFNDFFRRASVRGSRPAKRFFNSKILSKRAAARVACKKMLCLHFLDKIMVFSV